MASSKHVTPEVAQEENATVETQEDGMEVESGMQELILRFNDTDITVNVDSATAYLLTNDHNYAEQYAEALINDEVPAEPPEIEYLIEDEDQPTSVNTDMTPEVTSTTAGKQEPISKNNSTGVINTLWTFGHMELLLNVRLNLESKFLNPTSKKYELWNQVAKKFNSLSTICTTGTICHTKWRNMINTYKKVLKNVKITGKTPNWPLYDVLFEAYGDLTLNEINENLNVQRVKVVKDRDRKLWRNSDIKLLISSRLEMQELFMQPGSDSSELWTAISHKINCVQSLPHPGITCKTKWISLLGTYKKKLDYHETGDDPYVWPYFKMFHDTYKGFTVDEKGEDIQEEKTGKWTHTTTKLLIQTRIDMDVDFKSQNKPRSWLWSTAAGKVNAQCNLNCTGTECDAKWRSLMKTYRKTSSRMYETGERSTVWPHYNLMDQLFESTYSLSTSNTDGLVEEEKVSDTENDLCLEDSQKLWTSSDIDILISSRLEMQAIFSVTNSDREELWSSIAQKVNCVSSLPHPGTACKTKWLQLLGTYKSKLDYNESGEDPYLWPYFKMFHGAYEGFIVNHNGDTIQEEKTAVWTHGITKLLVLTRIDMDKSFQSQNIKKATLWSKVAAKMNVVFPMKLTGADCDCKWRNLMGTYRKICSRIIDTGENNSSWPYYDIIDKLYGGKSNGLTSNIEAFLEVNINDEDNALEDSNRYWTPAVTNILIKTRIEMEEKFQNPKCKQFLLWNEVSKKVNTAIHTGTVSGTECNVKWRNLKRTYRMSLSKIKEVHAANSNWPYFKAFHDLYGDLSNSKSPVEVEVSFNEDHGYVFEVLPTNVAHESEPEIVQSRLNSGTFQPKPVPSTLSSESQLPKTNQGLKRMLNDPAEEIAGPSKMCAGNREESWLKHMLLDWKKDRRERWEEKKQIEREKITAVNNLTKAILSLERR